MGFFNPIPSTFRPGQARVGIEPEEPLRPGDVPVADEPAYAVRDEVRASVRWIFDSVAAQLWTVAEEALEGLASEIDLLFEFGIEGNDEFQALVRQYLKDLPGDELDEIDAGLARLDWTGDIPQHLRWMAAHVKQERTDRAASSANESPSEHAGWKREHRDIGLQLKWLSKPLTGVETLSMAGSLLRRMMPREDDMDAAAYDEEFGAHVELLLHEWSDDRLVCLQYNLNSLRQTWFEMSRDPGAPVSRKLEPLKDPEVRQLIEIVSLKLDGMLEKRGVDEPFPEQVMLRAANNMADVRVLAEWLRNDRVSDDDVIAAFGNWSSSSLQQLVRNLEMRNPGLYHTLVHSAETILAEREAIAARRAEVAPTQAVGGTSRLRFIDGGGGEVPAAASDDSLDASRKSVGQYTSWGSRYSAGSLVNTALRWLTLSEPARRLGNWIQHGHSSGVLYAAGAVVKGLASMTGAASGIVASAVSVVETLAVNVVGGTLRVVAATGLGLVAVVAKAGGLASPAADRAGDKMAGAAKDLVGGISMVSKKPAQVTIPPHLIERASRLAQLARITGSTTASVRNGPLPEGFSRANRADIPPELLSREAGGTGRATKLCLDRKTGVLTGDRWSGIKVGVYVETDAQGNGIAYHLSFVGTQATSRPATLKSDVAQSLLGFEDSAFRDADAIVKAFVARHGADKVKLQGHSLGGALAQWAGIKNSDGDHAVKVSCFNAAGLHVNMRNRLGEALIAKADVEHFNTGKDGLSQALEGARSPLLGTQVGRRYVIPESGGHSLKHHIAALECLPEKTATRHALPLALVKEAASIRKDVPMKLFGHGAVNEVYRAVAILPDGTALSGVYKKDGDDVHNAALRSLATSKLDQRLGLGVIARTHLVVGAGEVGSIMEFAKGTPPVHVGNRNVEVKPEVARAFQRDPALLDEFARSKGFIGATIDGETITMVNVRPRDPADESAGVDELVSFNGAAFGADSSLWREVTKLQWLDALTGQRDRHAGNYFVSRDVEGKARVTGIDNDLAFDADLLDPQQRPSYEAPRLPRAIDITTALALLALTPAQIEEDCAGLSEAEIEATKARLVVLQDRIRSFAPGSPMGEVLAEDADWTQEQNANLLGISAFEADAGRRGVDYMLQEAARTGYAAREMSPYAANQLGAKLPIIRAAEFAAVARGKLVLLPEAEELS